jgi:hypothetical protein
MRERAQVMDGNIDQFLSTRPFQNGRAEIRIETFGKYGEDMEMHICGREENMN